MTKLGRHYFVIHVHGIGCGQTTRSEGPEIQTQAVLRLGIIVVTLHPDDRERASFGLMRVKQVIVHIHPRQEPQTSASALLVVVQFATPFEFSK